MNQQLDTERIDPVLGPQLTHFRKAENVTGFESRVKLNMNALIVDANPSKSAAATATALLMVSKWPICTASASAHTIGEQKANYTGIINR